MIASLVDARLALAGTTLDNLTTLNSKLEKVVSTPPKNHAARRGRKYDDDDEAAIQSDASSDSDPAELFHVDVGTQTTPGLSRSGSFSHISPASQEGDGATSKISSQQSRLNDIQDDLLAMNLVNGKPTTAERSLASTMRDLTSYLTSLDDESTKVRRGGVIYNGSSNSSGGRVAWPSSSSRDANTGRSPAVQEDAVDSFRAEIRGIKGVLLSAKNFPAAGGLGVGGVR
ncbi:MAG: hypothetical protein M1815_001013 [Lichina confinis]|nr:MAG: hypothetical protein M1815_001013 [Lichina confinis]